MGLVAGARRLAQLICRSVMNLGRGVIGGGARRCGWRSARLEGQAPSKSATDFMTPPPVAYLDSAQSLNPAHGHFCRLDFG